ncbi:MAG: ABC transporter permease [Planctomycetota bacterium]|jgi:ribose transport system permease protein|nr:ABC transporter permease [Planctomycetota bacterium]
MKPNMRNLKDILLAYGVYIAFALLFVIFAITLRNVGAGFLDPGNLMNILRQTCLYAILAVGMAFVLAAAQIDLSIGPTIGLVSLVAAMLMRQYGIAAGVGASLLLGVGVGCVNGLLVAYVRMPPMVATLGTMTALMGAGRTLTNLRAVPIVNGAYNFIFGGGSIGGFLPVSFVWMLAIMIVGHIVMFKTKYGRRVLATGGNEKAALYSGINTRRILFSVMVINGFLAALVGLLWAGRFAGGRYSLGESSEILVIAATVLGGTSINGGRASIVGAALGAVMIGMLDNALVLYGLDVYRQMIVRGIVIILAVALTTKRD